MKTETKRLKGTHGIDTVSKRTIGGNTYVVHTTEVDNRINSHHIIIYADKVNGDDLGMPDPQAMFQSSYVRILDREVKKDEKLAAATSKAINEAVGKLTGRLEQTKSQEDAVLGALEANAEVHDE